MASQYFPSLLAAVTAIFSSLALSAGWHELGHALAFWIEKRRVSDVSVRFIAGIPISVRLIGGERSRLVAAAGPAFPGAMGILMFALYHLTGHWLWLWTAIGFSLHTLGLLPGNDDGDEEWGLRASVPASTAELVELAAHRATAVANGGVCIGGDPVDDRIGQGPFLHPGVPVAYMHRLGVGWMSWWRHRGCWRGPGPRGS